MYIDEDDRTKLEAMTELEREMILADRAEERDKARQRRDLLRNSRQQEEKVCRAGIGKWRGRQPII